MTAPFASLLRRVVDAPTWAAALAVGVALTSTAVVAGHRHGVPHGLPHGAEAAAAETPAQAVRPAPTLRRAAERPPAASRSADRRVAPRPRLPLAPSDAGQTVAAAKSSTVNVPGQCLAWSREQAGIPSRYVDAATAWHYATGRRPGDADPPRGAAVYWTGGSGGHGHVAISVGDGAVRSTDAAGAGQVATIDIDRLTRDWGLQYAGWSDSINGYRIPGVAAA